MYHLYHTEAFVLGGAPRGEGSKDISLFTAAFGLVSAAATSVREERSKLRHGLQDFTLSRVTLVRGKDRWRITNAEAMLNVSALFLPRRECIEMFARVFRLLRRLLAGEERHEQLFQTVAAAVRYVERVSVPAAELASVEIVLVLRILYLLGYLAPRGEFALFLGEIVRWGDETLARAASLRSLALSDINRSLQASHL